MEKQGSKRGNYVGGLLQLLDWNAKSRKKLFPEKSKQKKRCDGNLPMTRIQMMDVEEFASIKGRSDYSCASSVTDEEHFHGTKAPGVVARLMGLDSLPKSRTCELYSIPFSDSQSLPGTYYQSENLEYCRDSQIMRSSSLQDPPFRNGVEPKYRKVTNRPPDKFQTEILPPKSAKAIPVTCNKLLSPIKSANVIPPEDAAHIMEAAARIIESGPQTRARTKPPLSGSSSVLLRVRDLKEKPVKVSEGSQRSGESSAIKSINAASLRIFQDSQISSSSVKSKGKSISLALQAKANVQRREGLNLNGSRGLVGQKETSEIGPKQASKSQSVAQKSVLKKSRTSNSGVLQQNNQKQNSTIDRGKLSSKPRIQNRKVSSEDNSSAKQRKSSKLVGTSKVSSQKLGSEVKDDKLMPCGSGRATRKKRAIDENCYSERNHAVDNIQKDKNEKVLVHSSNDMRMLTRWDQESGKMGADVISFTFTAPITRSGLGYKEAEENCKILSVDSRNKRILLNSESVSDPKISVLSKGDDMLSDLLEQTLKELTHKLELSEVKSETGLVSMVPSLSALMSSTVQEENKSKCGNYEDRLESLLGSGLYSFRDPKLFMTDQKWQFSVLEPSSLTGSCSYSDTVDSNSSGGGKQCSSKQLQDSLSGYSISSSVPFERDAELSDSASSTLAYAKWELEASSALPHARWEVEYVKEILCNIEVVYKNYEIVNPHLFDQLETRKIGCGNTTKLDRRLTFDCVSECLELRCRQFAGGGYRLWSKGVRMIERKDKLAEDVCKGISAWRGMGDFMVDELVDSDMSSRYGRWLDFEIEVFEVGLQFESTILNSLIDEAVDDILVL